jgi:hypothetical protein
MTIVVSYTNTPGKPERSLSSLFAQIKGENIQCNKNIATLPFGISKIRNN